MVKVWRFDTGEGIISLEHEYVVTSIAISNACYFFVSASSKHTIKIWSL